MIHRKVLVPGERAEMYPEEQVEEEEHVLDAADATASHDGVERRCKTDRWSTVKLQKSTYSSVIFTCA